MTRVNDADEFTLEELRGERPEPWFTTFLRAGIAGFPGVGGPASVVDQRLREGRLYKARQFHDDLLRLLGFEDLVAALDRSPELVAMLDQALLISTTTGISAKRRVLAKVISRAALDDALVDESQLYASALQELEAPHLRAMERFRRLLDRLPEDDARQSEALCEDAWYGELVPIRAGLSRTGCSELPVSHSSGVMSSPYRPRLLSTFGRNLLNWILTSDDEGLIQ